MHGARSSRWTSSSPARRRREGPRPGAAIRRLLLLCAALLATGLPAAGQGSVVAPEPGFSLQVDGAPFFALGWAGTGTCTQGPPTLTRTNRDSVRAHLALMRRSGVNTLIEFDRADGRIVARAVDPGWYNWVNYAFIAPDGGRHDGGHPRPGAFVEGMRWLMDQAAAPDTAGRMYVFVSLQGFIRPGYGAPPGADHPDADTRLSCTAFSRLVEAERRRHADADPARAAAIPAAACAGRMEVRPFWEWTLRYVVQGLRDHPGLLGWFLWDEPEGPSYRHLFGIVAPGEPVRAYAGPASLPTPDLLRYAYYLVQAFEQEGKPATYRRHPLLVDIENPSVFFSGRFDWSTDGNLNPVYSSGPFDRLPVGHPYDLPAGRRHHVPGDLLGQDASGRLAHTEGRGTTPRRDWYWDPNYVSRNVEMLTDVVRRDGLWGSLVSAAQAQLPSEGAYAAGTPLRCPPNDEQHARLLNDRDLVWQMLTPMIDGARGYVYYAYNLLPSTGEGAEQARRSNRLLRQFGAAGLDRLLRAPAAGDRWAIAAIDVATLTNYVRRPPDFVGPAAGYDPGLSAFTRRLRLRPADYVVAHFGRSAEAAHYGHATIDPWPMHPPQHRLLRTAVHHYRGADYVFVSNAFDARIDVTFRFDDVAAAPHLEEGRFDLDPGGAFAWRDAGTTPSYDPATRQADVVLALEPYEARLFRLTYR